MFCKEHNSHNFFSTQIWEIRYKKKINQISYHELNKKTCKNFFSADPHKFCLTEVSSFKVISPVKWKIYVQVWRKNRKKLAKGMSVSGGTLSKTSRKKHVLLALKKNISKLNYPLWFTDVFTKLSILKNRAKLQQVFELKYNTEFTQVNVIHFKCPMLNTLFRIIVLTTEPSWT